MYIDNLTHPDLGIAVIEDDTNTSKSLTKRLLALMKAYLKGNNDEAEFLAIDGAEFWDIKSENITIDEIKEELNLKV